MGLAIRFATTFIAIEIALALLADIISPYPYNSIDLSSRLQPPSVSHILGTDPLGRDVFSRLLHGIRNTFLVSFTALAIASTTGVFLGSLSAVANGFIDTTLSMLFDVLYIVPGLFVAAALLLALGSSYTSTVLAISLTIAPLFYRVVRSAAKEVVAHQYIEAAKALGAPITWIITRYILKEVGYVAIPTAVYMLTHAIALEASLSVIGLGIQPPEPSLGNMVSEYRDYIYVAPHLVATPIALIAATIASLNILAQHLHKRLCVRF